MPTTSLIISTPGATANCYVAAAVAGIPPAADTPAEADAYFANTLRQATWEAWAGTDRERALIQATQELEALGGEWVTPYLDAANYAALSADEVDNGGRARFTGMPYYATQSLHFPRLEDLLADGTLPIPKSVKAACCEQAFWLLTKQDNPDLLPRDELRMRGVRSIAVDGLSETYANAQVPAGIAPNAYRLIKPYLITGWRVESWR